MRAANVARLALLALSSCAALWLVAAPAAASSTITIINLDGAGVGLNDPTPVAPVGGNPGITLGAQRFNAMQFAADTWGVLLNSVVPIRVGSSFAPLFCNASFATLGQAGPNSVHRDFVGAPFASTWYAAALANARAGSDLNPGVDDIGAQFNSTFGTTCPFPGTFYYGFDASPPGGALDFVSIVLHEIGHGLGFLTFVDLASGAKLAGFDDIFMRSLENHSTTKLYPVMTNAERITASIDTGDLHWVGALVVGASGSLSGGVGASGHVQMYAPNPQEPGSSVSHYDTAVSPDELMEPFHTGPNHHVTLTLDLLRDIGWTASAVATTTPTPTVPPIPTDTPTPTITPTPGGDHFTCYKAGATSGSVKFPGIQNPPGVVLLDQFAGATVQVKKPKFLCAPTDKNNENPGAELHPEHLEGYAIKNSVKPIFPTNIQVIDQFNPTGLRVDAKKQSHLLVPTVKNLSGTPPTPVAFAIDHFECYKVGVTSGTPKFVPRLALPIEDQFGVMTVDVKKPTFLCNPVDKNGEDPTAPAHPNHLMCYQVRQIDLVKFAKKVGVFVNNQFGPEQLDVKKPAELCVPALKNL